MVVAKETKTNFENNRYHLKMAGSLVGDTIIKQVMEIPDDFAVKEYHMSHHKWNKTTNECFHSLPSEKKSFYKVYTASSVKVA